MHFRVHLIYPDMFPRALTPPPINAAFTADTQQITAITGSPKTRASPTRTPEP